MAFEQKSLNLGSLVAAADLSAKQFGAAEVNNAGQIANQTTAGARCIGVIQNKPKAGEVVDVAIVGVTKAQAASAIAAGDPITVDATGFFKTGTPGTDKICGRALDAAAAAGVIFSLLLFTEQA